MNKKTILILLVSLLILGGLGTASYFGYTKYNQLSATITDLEDENEELTVSPAIVVVENTEIAKELPSYTCSYDFDKEIELIPYGTLEEVAGMPLFREKGLTVPSQVNTYKEDFYTTYLAGEVKEGMVGEISLAGQKYYIATYSEYNSGWLVDTFDTSAQSPIAFRFVEKNGLYFIFNDEGGLGVETLTDNEYESDKDREHYTNQLAQNVLDYSVNNGMIGLDCMYGYYLSEARLGNAGGYVYTITSDGDHNYNVWYGDLPISDYADKVVVDSFKGNDIYDLPNTLPDGSFVVSDLEGMALKLTLK